MEGQTRPSVMGFSSMYFRSSKRFDRASLVEGFKQIKDRGVRYEDLFPGSYDPAARSRRSSRTASTPRSSSTASARCGPASSSAPTRSSRSRATASTTTGSPTSRRTRPSGSSATARCRPPGLDDAIAELHRCADLGLRTVQLESYPSGSFSDPSPEDDRFWAAAVELGMPINVHTQFFFPVGDLGSKITADGVRAGPGARQEAAVSTSRPAASR